MTWRVRHFAVTVMALIVVAGAIRWTPTANAGHRASATRPRLRSRLRGALHRIGNPTERTRLGRRPARGEVPPLRVTSSLGARLTVRLDGSKQHRAEAGHLLTAHALSRGAYDVAWKVGRRRTVVTITPKGNDHGALADLDAFARGSLHERSAAGPLRIVGVGAETGSFLLGGVETLRVTLSGPDQALARFVGEAQGAGRQRGVRVHPLWEKGGETASLHIEPRVSSYRPRMVATDWSVQLAPMARKIGSLLLEQE
jgi:hypothetical protein